MPQQPNNRQKIRKRRQQRQENRQERRQDRQQARKQKARKQRQGASGSSGTSQGDSNLPAPIRPVRGKEQIGRYVQSRVGREFNPTRRQLGKERRQVNRQRRQVNDLYRGYNQSVRNLAKSGEKATDKAVSETDARLQSAQQENSAFADALAGQEKASAELRGMETDDSTEERQQGAAAQREMGLAEQAALMRGQGTNRRAQMLENIRIGQGQRIQDQKRLMGAQRELGQDLRTLKRERGKFATEVLDDLRQQEREFHIQNRAFGGDQLDRMADLDYNDALRHQSDRGLEQARETGDAQRDTARIHAQRGRREEARRRRQARRSAQENVRTGMHILSELIGGPAFWRDIAARPGSIADNLVLSEGLSPREARAAVKRFVRMGREQEAQAAPPSGRSEGDIRRP